MSNITVIPSVTDPLRNQVISVLKLSQPTPISLDTNLHELGLESMSVVELLTQIEIEFDITVDVEDLSAEPFTRFGNLVEFVQWKVDGAV